MLTEVQSLAGSLDVTCSNIKQRATDVIHFNGIGDSALLRPLSASEHGLNYHILHPRVLLCFAYQLLN